jgi:dihydroorotate dehydrogenase
MTTAVITDGPAAVSRAVEGLREYLGEQGATARDLIGEAADRVRTYREVAR